jgi:hypothetical protein
MFTFGDAVNTVQLGHYEDSYCSVCEAERPFSLTLEYKWGYIGRDFGFVQKKAYVLTCDICQTWKVLDTKEVEQKLGRVPIPFMHRFGCLILAVVIVGGLLYLVLSNL